MYRIPSICSICAEDLVVDDVDPALCELDNFHGQRILARHQTQGDTRKLKPKRHIDWRQFIEGNTQIWDMAPDSCGFCHFLLRLLGSKTIIRTVQQQEEKAAIVYDLVSISNQAAWEERESSRPANFLGMNLTFLFHSKSSHIRFMLDYFLASHGAPGEKTRLPITE